MVKNTFTLAILIFVSFLSVAQNYDDLVILKADRQWDKLIIKADKYTLSNATSKDPEPYYYLALGLYKVSFEADRPEKYKNAYKDAFTAVSKMLRLDTDGSVTEKYEDFVDELKYSLLEIIQNELDVNQYAKAFGWAMRYYKFGRDYAPAYYIDGALRYFRDDKSSARTKWQEGEKLLKEADVTSWTKADKDLFMTGLYYSALALKNDRQMGPAKELMNMGAPYFEDNKKWSELYDEIMN